MKQSNKASDTITIDLGDYTPNTNSSFITSSNFTYDTTISGSSDTITIDNSTYSYANIFDNYIDPVEVDRMCKEYPALSKVWRNFKSVYDMTLQDYKGKKDEGEIYE